jgi:predicted RNA-binding protein with TRAM domain
MDNMPFLWLNQYMDINSEFKIEKNDKFTLEVTDINQDGQGIARMGGMVIFVDGALPGEKVNALLRML